VAFQCRPDFRFVSESGIGCIREQLRSLTGSDRATKRHGAGLAAVRHDGVASFLHENGRMPQTVTSNTHHPLESG
jgi:hypothetical protein